MLKNVSFKDIILSIIESIDLINPILKHHHRRTAIIAYHLGKTYGLDKQKLANLVISASLHDVGALTVEDSKMLSKLDVEDPEPHSILGAKILSSYEGLKNISKIIRYHHITYFDYKNNNRKIYFESLFLHLADRIEILLDNDIASIKQKDFVLKKIHEIYFNLFDHELVQVFEIISKRENFWNDIDNLNIKKLLNLIDFDQYKIHLNYKNLESLVFTISKIIDYKSSFTVTHSIGVAAVAYHLAKLLNLNEITCKEIKIAGYLHDIGKIAIPSELLNKPEKLSHEEYQLMKSHVHYTNKILSSIKGFEKITKWAASHHETLDGKGYPNHLTKKSLSIESLILAYADVFTALSEKRPYRESLEIEKVLKILKNNFEKKLGSNILKIILNNGEYLNEIRNDVQTKAYNSYIKNID